LRFLPLLLLLLCNNVFAKPPSGWLKLCIYDPKSIICSDAFFNDIKSAYVYSSDINRHGSAEVWKSELDRYMRRNIIAGDCEDFAITAIELASIYRIAKRENIDLVFCKHEGVGHLIAKINNLWFDPIYDNPTKTTKCDVVQTYNLKTRQWIAEGENK